MFKEANIIVSDSVTNYATVASFGREELIVNKFASKLSGPKLAGIKKAHLSGFVYGFSQFVQFAIYTVLFWSAAALLR